MRFFLLAISTILILSGCKSKQGLKDKRDELSTGTLDERSNYTSPEVGWTVRVPQDWPIITKKEMRQLTNTGKDIIKESTGKDIKYGEVTILINLKKNDLNMFLSTIEPFTLSANEYPANSHKLFELLKETYEGKNIVGEFQESTTKIDGLDFYLFTVKIFSKDREHVVLTQKYYSRLIDKFAFSMVLNYNNSIDQKTLNSMVQSSRFSKR